MDFLLITVVSSTTSNDWHAIFSLPASFIIGPTTWYIHLTCNTCTPYIVVDGDDSQIMSLCWALPHTHLHRLYLEKTCSKLTKVIKIFKVRLRLRLRPKGSVGCSPRFPSRLKRGLSQNPTLGALSTIAPSGHYDRSILSSPQLLTKFGVCRTLPFYWMNIRAETEAPCWGRSNLSHNLTHTPQTARRQRVNNSVVRHRYYGDKRSTGARTVCALHNVIYAGRQK